ncbi:MAG: SGNH/GDSL hydrolase family protein [Rhodocyclaceae bacterium]
MRTWKTLALAAGMALNVPAFASSPFSSLVVFGDSLSDNGNLYRLIDGMTPLIPNDGQPGLPYFFGRFSNGPVAVEGMAAQLGLPLADYAVAGAMTGTGHVSGNPALNGTGVLGQVAQFSAGLGGGADPGALYVVWAGPNDFWNGGDATTIATAVGNLGSAVQMLNGLGARNFLVPNMPDLGLTPRMTSLGMSGAAHGLTLAFNSALETEMLGLSLSGGGHVTMFDTYAFLNTALPSFSNTTGQCIQDPACILDSFNGGPALGYLFWDEVHPTAGAHASLGVALAQAVPEPQTYAMLLAGLGVIGWIARRRTVAFA